MYWEKIATRLAEQKANRERVLQKKRSPSLPDDLTPPPPPDREEETEYEDEEVEPTPPPPKKRKQHPPPPPQPAFSRRELNQGKSIFDKTPAPDPQSTGGVLKTVREAARYIQGGRKQHMIRGMRKRYGRAFVKMSELIAQRDSPFVDLLTKDEKKRMREHRPYFDELRSAKGDNKLDVLYKHANNMVPLLSDIGQWIKPKDHEDTDSSGDEEGV